MFDWREYLMLAEQLARSDSSEAELRTAISRAYYAVYHRASTYIRDQALVPATERLSHQKAWVTMRATGDPDRIDAAVRGDQLKRRREEADYRATFPDDLLRAAHEAIFEARMILDLIERA